MKASFRNRLLALAVVLAFGASLLRLFEYRFAAGDIYPPGSSRRADPLGSKALLEGLGLLPGLRVERNYERLTRLGEPTGTTLVLLGVGPDNIWGPMPTPDENEALDQFIRRGGRLVLALEHEPLSAATNAWHRGFRSLRSGLGTPTNIHQHFTTRLGFQVAFTNLPADLANRAGSPQLLPATLPWPCGWYLTGLRPEWHVVYDRADQVVVAERPYGSGHVVLLASDYLLLNGALRQERQPGFLAWLAGPNPHIVFDETHLGLTLKPGVAGLLRKYHLGGAVLGLALLAALHVWRQTVRFNPPPPPPPGSEVLLGRDSGGGFLSVLRRAVPPAQLSEVAFTEWRRSLGRHHSVPEKRLSDAQELVNLEAARPPGERNPVELHRRIARLLRHR